MSERNKPHGGQLIENRIADEIERIEWLTRANDFNSIFPDDVTLQDIHLLGIGALSPLQGFMSWDDYHSVIYEMRLTNGTPWALPIVLGVDKKTAICVSDGETVALREKNGHVRALLIASEIYPHDALQHAQNVYGTTEANHPGVARILQLGDFLLSGKVAVLQPPSHMPFPDYQFSPHQLREEFSRRQWKTIAGFYTRNPIHRDHEYLMKCALESTDGLLLQPLTGQTSEDELPASACMKSYEILLNQYFSPEHAMMAIFPSSMRYAGPREAVHHAIVSKNYGCTHFIVDSDHAGVKNPYGASYYESFAAHKIFDEFSPKEIGIQLLFYCYSFYCRQCEAIVTEKTAPHGAENRMIFTESTIRDLLYSGQRPPPEIMRPEIADSLILELADKERIAKTVEGQGI